MKKLNTNGFALLEGVLIVVAIAAVAGLGVFAYHHMKGNSTTKAHASSWTKLSTILSQGTGPKTLATLSVQACQTESVLRTIGAKPIYHVQFTLTNTDKSYRQTEVGVISTTSGSYSPTDYTTWSGGTTQSFTVGVQSPNGRITISEQAPGTGKYQYNIYNPTDPTNASNGGNINPALLTNC